MCLVGLERCHSVLLWIIIGVSLVVVDVRSAETTLDSSDGGPDSRCERVGQLLADPSSLCHYVVCQHGSTAWKEVHGEGQLATRRMPCAPGTHVEDDFEDMGDGKQWSPCTGTGHKCTPGKIGAKKGKPKSKFKRRSVYNKENSYHGYRKMSAPMSKKAPLTPMEDGDRLRHLVGLLGSLVADQADRFERTARTGPYDVRTGAIGNQWKQINREVGVMTSALSSSGARNVRGRPGQKSAAINKRDPRTLRHFSHRMMSVMLNLMRLSERTDNLLARQAAARQEELAKQALQKEVNSLEDFPGNALRLKRADGKMAAGDKEGGGGGGGGSSRSESNRRKFYDDEMEMHHSTDVFMMKVMMDRLRGRGAEHPKYGRPAGKEKLGYGDYKTFRDSKGQDGDYGDGGSITANRDGAKAFKYSKPKVMGEYAEGMISEYDLTKGLGLDESENTGYILQPVKIISYSKPPTTPPKGDTRGFINRKPPKRGARGPYLLKGGSSRYRGTRNTAGFNPPFRHMPRFNPNSFRSRFRRSERSKGQDNTPGSEHTPKVTAHVPERSVRGSAKTLRRADPRMRPEGPPSKRDNAIRPKGPPHAGLKQPDNTGLVHSGPPRSKPNNNRAHSHHPNKADIFKGPRNFHPLKMKGNKGFKYDKRPNPGSESRDLRLPDDGNAKGKNYSGPKGERRHQVQGGPEHGSSGPRYAPSIDSSRPAGRQAPTDPRGLPHLLVYRQKNIKDTPGHILIRSKRI